MVLSDPYSRPLLTPIPGVSNESGSVPMFKTPIPPSQLQQRLIQCRATRLEKGSSDTLSQIQHSDPYSHQLLHLIINGRWFSVMRAECASGQGSPFAQPLPMCRHPQRDPYSQAPSTPRPDYLQQMPDPYAQPPGYSKTT